MTRPARWTCFPRRGSIRAVSRPLNDLERRTARVPRGLLQSLAVGYGLATRVRNVWYDRVAWASRSCAVPVVSVGNITVGGTGKTPLVIEIAKRLCDAGRRPAIVTRGYGARPGETADEVLEYHDSLPDTPVIVDADRVRGAATAAARHAAGCVLLDDGFQHRRLRRDFDVVAVDALNPFGGGWMLPAGALREPLSGLRRASFLVLTRANLVRETDVQRIRAELALHAPQAPVIPAAIVSQGLTQVHPAVDASRSALRLLDAESRAAPLLPVCGIGNPSSFVRMIDAVGRRWCEPLIFPDHHDYGTPDVLRVEAALRERGAAGVVTTRKDWVKLRRLVPGFSPKTVVLRLDVRMELIAANVVIDRILARVAAPAPVSALE